MMDGIHQPFIDSSGDSKLLETFIIPSLFPILERKNLTSECLLSHSATQHPASYCNGICSHPIPVVGAAVPSFQAMHSFSALLQIVPCQHIRYNAVAMEFSFPIAVKGSCSFSSMLLNGQGLEVSPASGTPEAAAGASSGLDDPILIFHMASDQTTAHHFSFFPLFFMKRDELLKIFEQKFPFLERKKA